jgi:uncharacterized protein (DUF4213/DUF364 family)
MQITDVHEMLRRCVEYHGHFCIGQSLGVRIAKKGLEMNPREGELPPFAAEEVIPESDLVVITGTTLINKSLERLLELSRGKICVVLGPSTPMSDVLFDFGATVIAGVRVVDPDRLFVSLMQGVKFFHKIEGIKPVTRFRNYQPGSKSKKH